MKANTPFLLTAVLLLLAQACTPPLGPEQVATGVAGTLTALPLPTSPETHTPGPTVTPAPPDTPAPTEPKLPLTQPLAPTPYPEGIQPYVDAPLCADSGESHDNSLFHTVWDSARGCHYDHEHGQSPFTSEVASAFPGFDLYTLLGNVQVGNTNPSSPMENTHKHGGMKWNVLLSHPLGCAGRGGVPTGINASSIQYHNFGDYSIEFEARIHSAVALMRQCRADNPTDYGYVYGVQHVDYGQRVAPYQGSILPYPDTPIPAYDPAREPYLTVDCFGELPPCDKYPSRQYILDSNASADTTWTSESRGNLVGSGSPLFGLLFRARDNYQVLDWNDQTYPFTFAWLCSADGGLTYSAVAGCRYNNSTTKVHEIGGEIPASWDNLAGFDTDARVGRVTAEGFVTRFGDLNLACTAPGPDCHPLKLVQAFVGRYGSFLLSDKENQFTPSELPERDIYFCGAEGVCAEGDPGAVPSGWIGPNN